MLEQGWMLGCTDSLAEAAGAKATRETVAFDAYRRIYSTMSSRRREQQTHGIIDCRRAQVLLSNRNASIFSCGMYPTSLARISFNLGGSTERGRFRTRMKAVVHTGSDKDRADERQSPWLGPKARRGPACWPGRRTTRRRTKSRTGLPSPRWWS